MPVIANEVPHVTVQVGRIRPRGSRAAGHRQAAGGRSPIHVQRPGKGQLLISVWMMRGDEHKIVGRRLREVLSA